MGALILRRFYRRGLFSFCLRLFLSEENELFLRPGRIVRSAENLREEIVRRWILRSQPDIALKYRDRRRILSLLVQRPSESQVSIYQTRLFVERGTKFIQCIRRIVLFEQYHS